MVEDILKRTLLAAGLSKLEFSWTPSSQMVQTTVFLCLLLFILSSHFKEMFALCVCFNSFFMSCICIYEHLYFVSNIYFISKMLHFLWRNLLSLFIGDASRNSL